MDGTFENNLLEELKDAVVREIESSAEGLTLEMENFSKTD